MGGACVTPSGLLAMRGWGRRERDLSRGEEVYLARSDEAFLDRCGDIS